MNKINNTTMVVKKDPIHEIGTVSISYVTPDGEMGLAIFPPESVIELVAAMVAKDKFTKFEEIVTEERFAFEVD